MVRPHVEDRQVGTLVAGGYYIFRTAQDVDLCESDQPRGGRTGTKRAVAS